MPEERREPHREGRVAVEILALQNPPPTVVAEVGAVLRVGVELLKIIENVRVVAGEVVPRGDAGYAWYRTLTATFSTQ